MFKAFISYIPHTLCYYIPHFTKIFLPSLFTFGIKTFKLYNCCSLVNYNAYSCYILMQSTQFCSYHKAGC